MTHPTTSVAALRAAFAAILREDYAERDRLCGEVRRLMSVERLGAEADAVQRVMAVDFYVTSGGAVVPVRLMAQKAGVMQ